MSRVEPEERKGPGWQGPPLVGVALFIFFILFCKLVRISEVKTRDDKASVMSALSMMAASTPAFTMAPALAPRAAPATVTMGFESELGATGPLGLWDPLGLVRGPLLHPPPRACLWPRHAGA